jgi:hypothetical protein
MAFDEEFAARLRMLIAVHTEGEAEERRMFGGLAFLVGGRMVCGIVGRDLCARVPHGFYEEALGLPGVRPFDFTGRPLRGFVYVAPGLQDDGMLLEWIERGIRAAAEGGGRRRKSARPSRAARWVADF